MNLKDGEVKVKTQWKPTAGEPLPTWRRLWRKLLQRRPTQAKTAGDGECKDAEKKDS